MHYLKLLITAFIPLSLSAHPYEYDLIIIGAGSSGIIAAKTAASFGVRIAMIQETDAKQSRMLNSNIPLNCLIYAGEIAATVHRAREFGLDIENDIVLPKNVFNYIQEVVEHASHNFNIHHHAEEHTQILTGRAVFIDNHTVEVGGHAVSADKFIIATGGDPSIPSIEGIESIPHYTEETFFELNELPKSVIIAGEGPLSLELAAALHNLGVKITVITTHALILPKYDYELVGRLQKMYKSAGIKIKYHTEITKLAYINNKVITYCKNSYNTSKEYTADVLLFALSRSGRVDNMNLEKIGIEYSLGGILVNDKMQTSVPNIFACGNAVGQIYTLNNVSNYQAQIAAHNAAKYFWQKYAIADYSNVSSFIRTCCPFGAIGLTEQDARKIHGKKLKIYRYNYTSLVRAHIEKTADGTAKFICDSSGTLLGAHILGAAADLIIDNVRIGENFAKQFKDYQLQLRTSPNYLDLARTVAERSESDFPRSLFGAIVHYIKRIM